MSHVTYYLKQILPQLFYSPEGEAGACLEDWEKAELTASPLVEILVLFFFFLQCN